MYLSAKVITKLVISNVLVIFNTFWVAVGRTTAAVPVGRRINKMRRVGAWDRRRAAQWCGAVRAQRRTRIERETQRHATARREERRSVGARRREGRKREEPRRSERTQRGAEERRSTEARGAQAREPARRAGETSDNGASVYARPNAAERIAERSPAAQRREAAQKRAQRAHHRRRAHKATRATNKRGRGDGAQRAITERAYKRGRTQRRRYVGAAERGGAKASAEGAPPPTSAQSDESDGASTERGARNERPTQRDASTEAVPTTRRSALGALPYATARRTLNPHCRAFFIAPVERWEQGSRSHTHRQGPTADRAAAAQGRRTAGGTSERSERVCAPAGRPHGSPAGRPTAAQGRRQAVGTSERSERVCAPHPARM